jgi:hypothetical protein
MKDKTGSIIFYFILSLFFFALGAIVTILVKKYGSFTISNELNFTDLITIAFTIILTLYVAYYVERTKDIKRATKDMFISYYMSFLNLLKSKMEIISANQVNYAKKTQYFKLIRTHLTHLNDMSNERKIIKKGNDQIKSLFLQVTELWKISTLNSIINEQEKEKIELLLIKIEGTIHKLTFEINDN